jgi:hypothetical protein
LREARKIISFLGVRTKRPSFRGSPNGSALCAAR